MDEEYRPKWTYTIDFVNNLRKYDERELSYVEGKIREERWERERVKTVLREERDRERREP